MSDNPFAEPDDSDRTIIRPVPGGRRATAPQAGDGATMREAAAPPSGAALPPGVQPPGVQPPGGDAEQIELGVNPLVAAAAPLLQLLGRLRNTASQPNPAELRERAVREIRAFEQRARAADLPPEQVASAHYAICAALDDVVLNTPWGSAGGWDSRSLVSTFHQEVRSGERFFDLLAQLRQHPGRMLPVLELMYLCLSLGFQGRYRLSPRGPAELERVREDLYALIMRQRPAAEPGLSPHWAGVAAPYRPARAAVPPWVAGAGALAILGGLFVWFSGGLNTASDAVLERVLAAPPARMPVIARAAATVPPAPPPPSATPTALDTLRGFLKPEVDQRLVEVLGTPSAPLIRLNNRGLFASGSASLNARAVPLLQRIGAALKAEPGRVVVSGYTDNEPIHTVRFPSNFQLSAARAQAALEVLAQRLGGTARLTAEGRADADPVASNATPEGRAANRRIEIVLQRQGV